MYIYPEMESWDEFYPSEIFISYTETEDITIPLKRANIGAKMYLGVGVEQTAVLKKVAEVDDAGNPFAGFIALGYVVNQ